MDESFMLKAALLVALLGLACLIAILKFGSIGESTLSEAKSLEEGSVVRISGTVEKAMVKEGLTRITLTKEESVEVILFESINLTPGAKVEIQGKIQEYEGKNEILADKIMMLSSIK